MAVMEISLPSGYVMDEDSLPSLRAIKDVKKVETKEGGTGISLYFDKVIDLAVYSRKRVGQNNKLDFIDDQTQCMSNCAGLSCLQSCRTKKSPRRHVRLLR